MSMYNMMFGNNPASDIILATLGLTRADTGRFRDCFISEGEIAVYTRNGGNNRSCHHDGYPKYGNESCKHHTTEEEIDETVYVEQDQVDKYPQALNVFMGSQRMVKTGKKVMQTYYWCDAPYSDECTCAGCTITYQLPKHPQYLRDQDDDFDNTYATIYFSFPAVFKDGLAALDSGEKFDSDQRWINLLDNLSAKPR